MAYATNATDGTRIYFEDDGGAGAPVLFYGGLLDPVPLVRASAIPAALPRDEFRPIFADLRGHGRSDKPHATEAYAMRLLVADALAVLDAAGVDRAHLAGNSFGARVGFAVADRAPERTRALVLGGQVPYALRSDGPLVRVILDALVDARSEGIEAVVVAMERFAGKRFADADRVLLLDNDAAAMEALLTAAVAEGAVAHSLGSWRAPCLIYAGARDTEFHDLASRAAAEIPGAEFMSLGGLDHLAASMDQQAVVDAALRTLRAG